MTAATMASVLTPVEVRRLSVIRYEEPCLHGHWEPHVWTARSGSLEQCPGGLSAEIPGNTHPHDVPGELVKAIRKVEAARSPSEPERPGDG